METMYFSPLRLIRAVLPKQRKRKSGVIANVSSSAALEPQESIRASAGAKGGLDALNKVLAKEVAESRHQSFFLHFQNLTCGLVRPAVEGAVHVVGACTLDGLRHEEVVPYLVDELYAGDAFKYLGSVPQVQASCNLWVSLPESFYIVAYVPPDVDQQGASGSFAPASKSVS
ncbi:hypothetical protein F5B21DRAFT_509751 [Xylaria acuta]|nr:hypothetical protein F5B21DRAFT_509751 [Xylaria acuta]